MPLPPEQALDESTHRKVEGSFDSLRLAARQIRAEADSIRRDGGEERLADLLEGTAEELTGMLTRLMSAAYFGASDQPVPSSPEKRTTPPEKEEPNQGSLFEESGEDSLAA